jgi:hypothetical protein
MKSLADQLPPEIACQIDPAWRKNEADYWAVRDQLLGQFKGRWVGFADGVVVASGVSPVAVFHAAEDTGRNPFVTCVGHENEPTIMRRANFAYDVSYPGEPLPVLSLEFRSAKNVPGVILNRVIADTGADASAIPLGRLSSTPIERCSRKARRHARSCRWHRVNSSFPDLGIPGRKRVLVPVTGRFLRTRTHSRSRRVELLEHTI